VLLKLSNPFHSEEPLTLGLTSCILVGRRLEKESAKNEFKNISSGFEDELFEMKGN